MDWLALLFGGAAVVCGLPAAYFWIGGETHRATVWGVMGLLMGACWLLCWLAAAAGAASDSKSMSSKISRRRNQIGIAALVGYVSGRVIWDATGDTGLAWGSAVVISVIAYFVSTRLMASAGIGQGDVISLRIATSYHLAVVVEEYEDRVWLRLFNAGWLERPDGFVGNDLLAQDAAWQSQDYVLMSGQFQMAEPRRIGAFHGELTSRAVAS